MVRNSGPKFEIFWFGLGLGHAMVCDVTLACAQAHIVVLIKELAQGAVRKVSQTTPTMHLLKEISAMMGTPTCSKTIECEEKW